MARSGACPKAIQARNRRPESWARFLSDVFREIHIAHIAGFGERRVERIRGMESSGSLPPFVQFELIPEQLAVHRMGTVFDNGLRTLERVFCPQVCDTLVGYEDVDRVFRVIRV